VRNEAHPGVATLRPVWQWTPVLLSIIFTTYILLSNTNHTLFTQINNWYRHTGDSLWSNLSSLADTLVAVVLLLPLCGRRPDILRAFLIAAIFSTLWVHVLKFALAIPRPAAVLPPDKIHIIGPVLHIGSFPSGHTTTAFTIAAVCGLLSGKRSLVILFIIVAGLAGLSRIVVGAHWPMDVLAGVFGGWLAAIGGIYLAKFWPAGCGLVAQRITAIILLLCAVVLVMGYDTHYPNSTWLLTTIGITCPIVAVPGLLRLWRGHST
jgi:membrane-associated phospholipid phosphatase